MTSPSPLRLRLDSAALAANWRVLDAMSVGAACGAAVKANGYGLGAREVVRRLVGAGCRDFFVATWAEALEVAEFGVSISVLHGVRAEDMGEGLPAGVRPVLNTPEQVRRWVDLGFDELVLTTDIDLLRKAFAALRHEAEVALGIAPDSATKSAGYMR